MKKTRLSLVLCTISVLLLGACVTVPPAADPVPTKAPVTTVAPTEAPAVTETPVATETPANSEEPTATETPVATEAPATSEEPVITEAPAVTEAPTTTDTPDATDTPKPTATPDVTEEPDVLEKPTVTEMPESTATPAPTTTPVPTATPKPTVAPSNTTTRTYDFNDLTYLGSYGTSYNINSDGSVALQYEGQYQEIKLSLPELINMKYCHRVTVRAKSEFAPISVKLYDSSVLDDFGVGEIFVNYNCMGDGIVEYELLPDLNTTVAGIGIMALDDVTNFSQYKATVYSVTFHLDEGYTDAPAPTPFVPESLDGATLLNTYGKTFGYLGTCINLNQLQNASTLALVKSQYNSMTLENEMKPNALLSNWSPSFISVEQAKQLGYVIPSNYKESTVPRLNFSSVDRALEICGKNGLAMRAHTLVWHSQTPLWFFKTNYSNSGSYVSKEVMDARMEFYIRTVMSHVYNHEYGDVVYAWDVVNEYWNADSTNWIAIYGAKNTSPSFVKKAFEIADDVLRDFGIRDKVTLIFNDYNTYMNTSNLISIVNYINSDGIICDGFGMQAHLDTGYPSTNSFKNTVNAFLNTGLEVQITELDVTTNNSSVQEKYYYELMTYLLDIKKNGGKITGLTYWGISDQNSWRGDRKPLLFSTPTNPKDVYYRVLQAYMDAGFSAGN